MVKKIGIAMVVMATVMVFLLNIALAQGLKQVEIFTAGDESWQAIEKAGKKLQGEINEWLKKNPDIKEIIRFNDNLAATDGQNVPFKFIWTIIILYSK